MPDNPTPTNSNGMSDPRPTLREVAEATWEDVVENAPDDGADDGGLSEDSTTVDSSGRRHDATGRFVAKPGEAAPEDGTQPREDETAPQQPESPTQPAQAVSSEAPQNWSAQDRQTFTQLPEQAKEFLLRRHSDMEGDYQRRVQAVGGAAQFAEAVAPVFQDPVIQGSLRQNGISPIDAIQQWAGMHRRAYHPDPRERVNLLVDIARNVGLDPATIFAASRSEPGKSSPALSEQDLQDPAIRYFADHVGRTSTEVQALRSTVQQLMQQRDDEVLRVTRMNIDSFADERDSQGNPLRPDFDVALPALMELYRGNPNLDLREAYEEARWRTRSIRDQLVANARTNVQQQASNERARAAARSNVRGPTSPVTKPSEAGQGSRGLRATLEATADEVGL
jgi:hypothetical protein